MARAAFMVLALIGADLVRCPVMAERCNPVANDDAVVTSLCGRARFTVLSDRLVRMEYSASGTFEDRASQAFINRRTQTPRFVVERVGREARIATDRLRLFFQEDGKAFHPGNLRAEFSLNDRRVEWRPGMDDAANLGGTIRTLDNVNGSCPVKKGLLSRDGWAVVDDSRSLVFQQWKSDQQSSALDWDWLTVRGNTDAQDWYLFAHGHDYASALRDFTMVAGKIPLPPRYVFGSWWSRYWAYTDEELKSLVNEFREHDVPLDVLVIDMDWHLDGWTGYTWSDKYFPDPEGFLKWTDQHGLQITLNLHPADGVGRHEAMFEEMCRAVGRDPAKTEFVPFDCTDRRFVRSYFELLHWPLEKQGVDFWWMDWQQGTKTNTPGLDPLWWLNHLHWKDLEERQEALKDPTGVRRGRRPLIFSRWGGLGNHRYPIGFSGDTYSTWASLAWQPQFTSMAGNVGYAYWSHDIGGHQPGPVDPELYARWIQFGALSPVLRTHTSKNPQGERRIWASPEREFKAMREAFLLRYRLLPYLYTAARRTYDDAVPLCRPLYWHWPEEEEAYDQRFAHQYMFGDDLLAAPVIEASDRASRAAMTEVWLPPGTWTNWYTGETLEGPRVVTLHVPIGEIPLFARGGAIIPTAPAMRWSNERPLEMVTLIVWPGGTAAAGFADESGHATLYEDDGEGAGYERGECARTRISYERLGESLRMVIAPAEGEFAGMVRRRSWQVRLVDRWPARSARINGREAGGALSYDEAKLTIVVDVPAADVREQIEIDVMLDAADEAPLRAGVHGGLKMWESLGALLGSGAPVALRDAAEGRLRRQTVESRGSSTSAMLRDPDAKWRLAAEIAAGGEMSDDRQEAACRLLGFSGSIVVRSDAQRAGRILTESRARVIHSPADAMIETRLEPPTAWACESRREEVHDHSAVERCAWSTPALPEMATLRAAAMVRRGKQSIVIRLAESVLPSINAWWVVGPFACPVREAMGTPFGPEMKSGMMPSPEDTYSSSNGGPLKWRRVVRSLEAGSDPGAEFFVDLNQAFGGQHDDAVAYAMTFLHAQRDTEAVLALGSDDGVAAWINGEKVHENDVQRGYGSKQDLVPIRLRAGRNTLVLKVTQGRMSWGFGAHVQDARGMPAEGIAVKMGEQE